MNGSPILRLGLTAFLFSARLFAQDGTWATLSAMPVANSEFAAAAIDDRIFCVGGFAEDNQHRTLVYEPQTDVWRTAADVPHEIHHANVAVAGGKLYVFGGGHQASDHVQIYDPARNHWSEGRPMPTPRIAVATPGTKCLAPLLAPSGCSISRCAAVRTATSSDVARTA
jgi:N-acetylneuraminic acid mutarotase